MGTGFLTTNKNQCLSARSFDMTGGMHSLQPLFRRGDGISSSTTCCSNVKLSLGEWM
jgi:hypothetical protein